MAKFVGWGGLTNGFFFGEQNGLYLGWLETLVFGVYHCYVLVSVSNKITKFELF